MKIETFSEKETFELGKKLGTEAKPGQVYALLGDLGVGLALQSQSVVRLLPLFRFMKKAECRFIILMYTGSEI